MENKKKTKKRVKKDETSHDCENTTDDLKINIDKYKESGNDSTETKIKNDKNKQEQRGPQELMIAAAIQDLITIASKKNTKKTIDDNEVFDLPIINSKDLVLFPGNILPFMTNTNISVEYLDSLAKENKTIGVVAQNSSDSDENNATELFSIGTEAKIVKIIRFPEGTIGALVQGIKKFRIVSIESVQDSILQAKIKFLTEQEISSNNIEIVALVKSFKQLINKAISLSPNIPSEIAVFIENIPDIAYMCNIITPHLSISYHEKHKILSINSIAEKVKLLHYHLAREIDILEVSQKINIEVKSEINKQQKKYYVKEQLKLLQKELSDLDGKDDTYDYSEVSLLQKRLEKSNMPKETKDIAKKEITKLQNMSSNSPEYTMNLTYIHCLLDLPWGIYTQKSLSLNHTKQILDNDHYSLEKVKKRVLEFIAVFAIKKSVKGPILLLSGPPGVGKTSLGKSIAKSLGRNFARISLGGIKDEAEIRGHRRTYIGSMPGRIFDAIKKAGSMDAVILLDEVDKLTSDFRGDPTSALLEVLDPEQNDTFTDHYLNFPLDLSKFLFICTANNQYNIPDPLRDRMEIIELSGYTLSEKNEIAIRYLWPKIIEESGINKYIDLNLSDNFIKKIILQYTREAGVRQLKRELSTVVRNVAVDLLENDKITVTDNDEQIPSDEKTIKIPITVNNDIINKALGHIKFLETQKPMLLNAGISTGLAYTTVGGDVLFVEAVLSEKGTGKVNVTGLLGEVMKESVHTALSYILANTSKYRIKISPFEKKDLHIHFPEGAVKKDGPSAGVAVFLALVSLFSQKSLASDLAMTGEISLRGKVLPVGGIKEKLIAAHRYGIKIVMIPIENLKDLDDLPLDVRANMEIRDIQTMDDAFSIAFGSKIAKGRNSQKGTNFTKNS